MSFPRHVRHIPTITACALGAALLGASSALMGVCGPFADVAADSFCPFVQEVFYLGITTGTTPTTYDPAANVSRLQMAAFLSRSVDGVLKRGSRRAALNQFWTTQSPLSLGITTLVSPFPSVSVQSDGEDLWVVNLVSHSVCQVHGSNGKLLQTWTGASFGYGVLVAMGRIFVSGETTPGTLYQIDPSQPAGSVTTVASNLGAGPTGIAFDGSRIWTANNASVSIITPGPTIPWTATTVSAGFSGPAGALYDGANIWVADAVAGTLLKLDASGIILQTVTVGTNPTRPIFDGSSIWVPNASSNSITVVRASSGAVLATLTGNGINKPFQAAFDGQRILVTNFGTNADSVSLWKAADLAPLGSFSTGPDTDPYGACSDGINFWITFWSTGQLARF